MVSELIELIDAEQDNFIKWRSWFDEKYKDNLDQRWPTMKVALNILNQMDGPVTIVETGCVRQEDDWGGGMSTLLFAEYLEHYGGKLITIDNVPRHMLICKYITRGYKDYIEYVLDDSLVALGHLAREGDTLIDLLYLDSMDCPLDESSAVPAQEHALKEFKLAEQMLHDKSIVLIDDNGFENGGKAGLLNMILPNLGWTCLMQSQQSLWVRR